MIRHLYTLRSDYPDKSSTHLVQYYWLYSLCYAPHPNEYFYNWKFVLLNHVHSCINSVVMLVFSLQGHKVLREELLYRLTFFIVLVRVPKKNRTNKICVWEGGRRRLILRNCFRQLWRLGKSKICRVGWQPGDPGKSCHLSPKAVCNQNSLGWGPLTLWSIICFDQSLLI